MENNYNLANVESATPSVTMTDTGLVADLTSGVMSYCSFVAETDSDKKTLYNIQNATADRVSDHVGETVNLRHVYVETVQCTNEETGEVTTCPRIILIDDKNKGYACVSLGIFSALRRMFAIYGTPDTWSNAIKIKFRNITKGKFKILTFDIV